MNGTNDTSRKDDTTLLDKIAALPWRKFLVVVAVGLLVFLVATFVSCSVTRVTGNNGNTSTTVRHSVDSTEIVVRMFPSP